MFKLPLHDRQRLAADKRRRYWSDPHERLKRINLARRYRGAPEIASLSEIGKRRPIETRNRERSGRFAPDGDAA